MKKGRRLSPPARRSIMFALHPDVDRAAEVRLHRQLHALGRLVEQSGHHLALGRSGIHRQLHDGHTRLLLDLSLTHHHR